MWTILCTPTDTSFFFNWWCFTSVFSTVSEDIIFCNFLELLGTSEKDSCHNFFLTRIHHAWKTLPSQRNPPPPTPTKKIIPPPYGLSTNNFHHVKRFCLFSKPPMDGKPTKIKWKVHVLFTFHFKFWRYILLIKIFKYTAIQPSDLSFLVVFIRFYFSRYEGMIFHKFLELH